MHAETPTRTPSSATCAIKPDAPPACPTTSGSRTAPSTPETTPTALDIVRPAPWPSNPPSSTPTKRAPTATEPAPPPIGATPAVTTIAPPASTPTPADSQPPPSHPSIPPSTPTIRLACHKDLTFVDKIQKLHRNSVGFLNRSALEAYIHAGHCTLIHCNGWEAGYVIHPPNTNGITRLAQIAIHPDVLRSTLGTQLMATVEASAIMEAQTAIRLRSRQDLDANLFWPKLGYTLTAIHTAQGRKNLPRYEWTRHLQPLIYTPCPIF